MSDWEDYLSLKIHPGWQKLVKWINAESELRPHTLAQLARNGNAHVIGSTAIRADALLSVVRRVDEEIERIKRENEAKAKADNPK